MRDTGQGSYILAADAGLALGRSSQAVIRCIQRGEIEGGQLPSKHWFVTRAGLQAALAAQSERAPQPV